MIVERIEHPDWLSNAYLVADAPGGSGVLVDANGLEDALVKRAEEQGVTLTHVLCTHGHPDHVVGIQALAARLDVPLLAHPDAAVAADERLADGQAIASGDLEIETLYTPGHCPDHVAFLFDGTDCLTADCLFKGTVGGTAGGGPNGFAEQVHSIVERLLTLPPKTRIHPGHREPSTVGDELERNPFVRVWRGLDPEGSEPCRVRGEEATLVLWGPDYDGTHKAWVRFLDGREAIVGGSQVERET
ncbi:MAG TPA: MBL fold metallo-hydrolase [Gaiellaceae bacterium]|nr:MBL fold metallo-hydrolase [Gaiellaceae bacterium]